MKKIIVSIMFLSIILTGIALADEVKVSEKMKEHANQCEFNIKILANALELYANDHFVDYPTKKEFMSHKFDKYIFKALGKKVENTDQFYRCPPKGWLKYERVKNERAFKLFCPKPEIYGLKELSFSSREGFIKDDGTQKTGGIDVKVEKVKDSPVTPEEKAEINSVIKELYEAYKNKDLEKVMDIEEEAIVRAGKEAEKRGKYTMIEVYYAFKGTKNDVFRAEGFKMEPLNLSGVMYKKTGEQYIASSPVPVIATNVVKVGNMKVRLRIASFTFERIKGKLRIVKMQLY